MKLRERSLKNVTGSAMGLEERVNLIAVSIMAEDDSIGVVKFMKTSLRMVSS